MPDKPIKPSSKSISRGIRIPLTLFERFAAIKPHKIIDDSKLLLQAIALYVELGERFGLDEDLRPMCQYEKLESVMPQLQTTGRLKRGR